MRDPVVVVDADRRLLDLNPAAGRVFDLSAEVIGAQLDTAPDGTPDLDALLATSGEPTEFTSDGRIYEATPSVIRDEYDRPRVTASCSTTSLEHGSGPGLWLVEWGVARLDGTVAFAANEPRGTVVILRLPMAST